MDDLQAHNEIRKMNREVLQTHQKVFGYTEEELQHVVAAMAESGEEPISAMGIDMPLAILSSRPQLLFDYFKQKFAQVTNPPIDPIREKIVMSLVQYIGKHGQLLDEIEIDKKRNFIELKSPILRNDELERLRHLYSEDFKAITLPMTFPIDGGKDGLKNALENLCKRAEENIRNGYNILVISDTNLDLYNAPIPSLLALGAVHHYLIRKKLRTQVDLVMECGDARDVMHMALLIGYGAKAVNPYMALESIRHMVKNKQYIGEMELEEGYKNYCNAIALIL